MEMKRFLQRKVELTDADKAYIEKKVQKFTKHFSEEAEVSIIVSSDNHNMFVEFNITDKGNSFRAKGKADKATAAADEAASNLDRQLRKYSTRLQKFNRDKAKAKAAMRMEKPVPADDQDPGTIAKVKDVDAMPMSVEDAIMKMELLGHSFFVFENHDDNDQMSILYRRDSGDFGIMRVHTV